MLYCIKHESMVKSQLLFDTVKITHPDGAKDERAIPICFIHEDFTMPSLENPGGDYDVCDFPLGWATCPPPEVWGGSFEEWFDSIGKYEPDQTELDSINSNATLLLADLEAR